MSCFTGYLAECEIYYGRRAATIRSGSSGLWRFMDISVVIPTFNRARLLERCLRSLVESGVGLEITVVDDGGTDDTAAITTSFPGVLYKRQTNAGPAAARNFGFTSSRGEYVAFIDSDDEWVDGGVGRLARQLDENKDLQVVFADSSMGNESSGFVSFVDTYGRKEFFDLPHEKRSGVRMFEKRSFFLRLSTRNVMFLGSTLFRREAFEELGGFDHRLCGAADWDLFMRAAARGRVGFSEGPSVSRYYKHDAAMSTNNDHMEEDFIHALDSVRQRCELDPVERAHIDHRIREHIFGWAYQAYDVGDLARARQRLWLAYGLKQLRTRELSYLVATYFPPPMVGALRKARHALGV
jgi:glycosyltransferase involved in cell wall biosynthesis